MQVSPCSFGTAGGVGEIEMPMVHLGIIFLSIVALLVLRRPLYQAILGGLAATALLCHMHPITAFGQAIKVFANW